MSVPKWAIGNAYGPVLSSTDLYLLQAAQGCDALELHPMLTHSLGSFHLVLNLATGMSGGYDNSDSEKDLPFSAGDEPATIPRVQEIYIIAKATPWVTTVTASNDKRGVTLQDFIAAVWQTYGENTITDAEFGSLGVREQERVRRASLNNQMSVMQSGGGQGGMNGWYSPNAMMGGPKTLKRADWLRDKIFFDGLEVDDDYSLKRLGFKAPNIFVMSFCG